MPKAKSRKSPRLDPEHYEPKFSADEEDGLRKLLAILSVDNSPHGTRHLYRTALNGGATVAKLIAAAHTYANATGSPEETRTLAELCFYFGDWHAVAD
jgi:hypothetical protein